MLDLSDVDESCTHPSVLRELRLITGILAGIFMRRGLKDEQALAQARRLLRRPPGRHDEDLRSTSRRTG
ncbi:MAG: hypothetical protein ACE141_15030 [Bryobacteraceae bacterium]